MNRQAHSDQYELLDKLRAGDELAYNRVFFDHYTAVCRFAQYYVSPEQAEDVASDVFLELLQSNRDFQDYRHLTAWLYRAVKHICLDRIKSQKRAWERQHVFAEGYASEDNSIENREVYLARIMQTEALRILYFALDSLPEQTASVLRMTYLEGMSNQQAADELRVSINTIKTQKQRGLQKLRKILSRDQFKLLIAFLLSNYQ